jgi:sugar phosphate isomerase/epimerase
MKTAITLSLLPSRPDMPFVLGPDLPDGFAIAADLGFEGVEIFPPNRESLDPGQLARLSRSHNLPVSTIGTGGGALTAGLTLTDGDSDIRQRAVAYVRSIIEVAGDLGASAIIGSMQGRAGNRDRQETLNRLADGLAELGEYARRWQRPLFIEPLNRYETDLVHRLQQGGSLIDACQCDNVRLLADLFHMNIEESDIPAAIVDQARHIGHVHFVDSNRWPAGYGHTDLESAVQALQQVGYSGYLSVEAFPLPDALTAARDAAAAFRRMIHSRNPSEPLRPAN